MVYELGIGAYGFIDMYVGLGSTSLGLYLGSTHSVFTILANNTNGLVKGA